MKFNIFLINTFFTSFSFNLFIDPANNTIYKYGQDQCVNCFRKNDSPEIKYKVHASPRQETEQIYGNPIKQICNADNDYRERHILFIKNLLNIASQISDDRKHQGIHAKIHAKQGIHKYTTEKSDQTPFFFAPDHADGHGTDNKEVWYNAPQSQMGKYAGLKKIYNKDHGNIKYQPPH